MTAQSITVVVHDSRDVTAMHHMNEDNPKPTLEDVLCLTGVMFLRDTV